MAANEADVRAAILDSASKNSLLLVTLAKTSTAPGLLAVHEKNLSILKETLSEHSVILKTLKEDVDSKFKRHKKFRDSHTRRFFYRATNMLGKFDAKAMKEEREYFELLNEQSKADKRRLVLQRDYDKAVEKQKPLAKEAQTHGETHAQIDELYEKLFAGPTPGFASEDAREEGFYAARERNEATKEAIRATRRARRILISSQGHVKAARNALENADQSAVDSLFFLDEAMLSLRRANALITYATNSLSKTEEHFTSPLVELVAVKVEVDSYLKASKTNVDGAYTRDKIVTAAASALTNLLKAEELLARLATLLKEREETSLRYIRGTARKAEDSRQELEQFRRSIFEKVAGFGEAAPAYNECCDRADGFCAVPEEPREEPEHEHAGEGGDIPNYEMSVGPNQDSEGHSTRATAQDHALVESIPQSNEELPRRKDD